MAQDCGRRKGKKINDAQFGLRGLKHSGSWDRHRTMMGIGFGGGEMARDVVLGGGEMATSMG